MAKVCRDERADDAKNHDENEAARLVGSRHDEFGDDTCNEVNDECQRSGRDRTSMPTWQSAR